MTGVSSFDMPYDDDADKGDFLPRTLDLAALLRKKSHFLLGRRQTGKTTLIRHSLPETPRYDLLETATWLALSQNPGRLAEELGPGTTEVVIDEIQRLPQLLNEVHRLIEERGVRFLLTGSSARALRRGGVNLLGGRARTKVLHPLTRIELGGRFNLDRALTRGTLPSIWFSDDPPADLAASKSCPTTPSSRLCGRANSPEPPHRPARWTRPAFTTSRTAPSAWTS